ncbi:hypothetical protein M899_2505 [Bacteriovorax sp. BSW11_IV]|nr:hypothetical protein M899_2505 [Bacteriovorax sp. BSW11_IV]
MAQSEKAVVTALMGRAFVNRKVDSKPVMLEVKKGDTLFEFDEVFTEVGSQLSMRDSYDHDFHLSGSGYALILNRAIELKGGYLWVRSYSDRDEKFNVSTVNANTTYDNADFIISFDQDSGKTQLMSLKGQVEFANMVHSYLKYEVPAGKFSFISESYEDGSPRMPTPTGESTYRKVISLFDGVDKDFENKTKRQIVKKESPKADDRTPASATSPKTVSEPGSIIYVKESPKIIDDSNMIDDIGRKLASESMKKISAKKKFKPTYEKSSGVQVKVFGSHSNAGNRMPASVSNMKKKETMRGPASLVSPVQIKNDPFESSLLIEYKKQMRHSNEVNSLIKELKNYDQDYKESY